MCDTLVATSSATADGSVIFAKNTDRHPNEAHELLVVPAAQHPDGATVRCTYIDVPQVRSTHRTLLARPYWIWGAEMGINEHGVAIGNEAVFTKVPHETTPGLIGMDLLRLGLERATTARQALDVITRLLAVHGQGGDCGYDGNTLRYHNSFIIADGETAWVLETAGKHWVAEEVDGVRTISNRLTIGDSFDLASDDVVRFAVENGLCASPDRFHFAHAYSDRLYTTFGAGEPRQRRSTRLLEQLKGQIGVEDVMTILRDHGGCRDDDRQEDDRGGLRFWRGAHRGATRQLSSGPREAAVTGATVCMHAGFGPVRIAQTTGSLIAHLGSPGSAHWVTGTSTPCTSLFKPVWLDTGIPDIGPPPGRYYDEATLWWRHEALMRETLLDFSARLATFGSERDGIERGLLEEAGAAVGSDPERRRSLSVSAFARSEELRRNALARIDALGSPRGLPPHYAWAWRRHDQAAHRPRRLR